METSVARYTAAADCEEPGPAPMEVIDAGRPSTVTHGDGMACISVRMGVTQLEPRQHASIHGLRAVVLRRQFTVNGRFQAFSTGRTHVDAVFERRTTRPRPPLSLSAGWIVQYSTVPPGAITSTLLYKLRLGRYALDSEL